MVLLAGLRHRVRRHAQDKDTLTDLVSGTTNEATNTGYARKVLTDTDLTAFAPDDTNDRVDLDFADQTWTSVANDGTGAIGDLVVCYDGDTTGGTDANIEPQTQHDFSVTPSGMTSPRRWRTLSGGLTDGRHPADARRCAGVTSAVSTLRRHSTPPPAPATPSPPRRSGSRRAAP